MRGQLAQLVRAPRLHRGGQRFESFIAHQGKDPFRRVFPLVEVPDIMAAPFVPPLAAVLSSCDNNLNKPQVNKQGPCTK